MDRNHRAVRARSRDSNSPKRRLAEEALEKVRDDLESRARREPAGGAKQGQQLTARFGSLGAGEDQSYLGEKYYQSLIENALDVILVANSDGSIRYESPSVERVTGYKPAERLGKSVFELMHPDDLDRVVSGFVRLVISEIPSVHLEFRLQHRNGSWRTVEGIGKNLLDDPVVEGVIVNFRDITERRIAEDQLRTKEKALENSINAIAMSDMDGRITYVNRACVAMWGGNHKEELVGRRYWELLEASKMQAVGEIVNAMSNNQSWNGELVGIRRDGQEIHVQVASTIVQDDEGNPIQTISSLADVTERRKAEQALQESEKKFRRLVEEMNDGYCVVQGFRVVFANARSAEMFGYTTREVLGRTLQQLLPPEVVHDMSRTSAARQRGDHAAWQYEATLVGKDGTPRPVELGIRSVEYERRPALSVVIRDVAERRKMEAALRDSEAHYRLLAENVADVIWTMDMDLQFTYISPSVTRQRGYTVEEAMELGIHGTVTPASLEVAMGAITEGFALESEGQVDRSRSWTLELEMYCKDGSTIWTELGATFLRDAEGKAVGMVGVVRDITERRKAEEALRTSEAHLSALIGSLTEAVFTVSNGVITWCNDKVEDIYGFKKDELVGSSVRLLYPADTSPSQFTRKLASAMRKQGHFFDVARVRTKNGGSVDVEYSISPIKGKHPVEFVAVARDNSEQVRAREALQRSGEYFRALTENVLDAIVVLNPDTTIRYKSPSFERMAGSARKTTNPFQFVHPDDTRSAAEMFEHLLKNPSATVHTEIRGQHRDGSWHTFEVTARNLLDNPVVAGIVANFRDITDRKQAEEERRQSEERFRNVLENSVDMVYRLNLQTSRYDYVSPASSILLGYSPEEFTALGIENAASLIHPDDMQVLTDNVIELITRAEPGEPAPAVEYRIKHRDGEYRWVSDNRSVAFDDANVPVAVVGNLRDITEQVKAQEEVRRLNEELEHRVVERTTQLHAVNRELEAFAYSVSHDLRAPLRSIDGFSQILLEDYSDKLDPEGQDYLKRVRVASQRMADLIDDLLNLSRVTRGEMQRETVDLSALAEQIAAELRQGQPDRDAEFIITQGLVADGDARLLRVALQNLLGNAWKFTRDRTPAQIEFGVTESGGQPAYFIRDNGVGFDMAYADKLFGAFQRLHSSSQFEGTGIGLATVQRIIHRHGGSITPDSAVGQGTTFHFTLKPI